MPLDTSCSIASPRRRPAKEAATDVDERSSAADRRASGDRRRYNRRSLGGETSPPYYETFERIAHALESIRDVLAGRSHDLLTPGPRTEERTSPGTR